MFCVGRLALDWHFGVRSKIVSARATSYASRRSVYADQFTPITKEGDRAIGGDPVSSFPRFERGQCRLAERETRGKRKRNRKRKKTSDYHFKSSQPIVSTTSDDTFDSIRPA
jgi:hypothetical protein